MPGAALGAQCEQEHVARHGPRHMMDLLLLLIPGCCCCCCILHCCYLVLLLLLVPPGERFAPLLPGMCSCIGQLKPDQAANMRKLLMSWRSESVLPGDTVAACETKLPGLTAAAAAAQPTAQTAQTAAAAAAPLPANGAALVVGGYVQAAPAGAATGATGGGSKLTPSKRVSVQACVMLCFGSGVPCRAVLCC